MKYELYWESPSKGGAIVGECDDLEQAKERVVALSRTINAAVFILDGKGAYERRIYIAVDGVGKDLPDGWSPW